MSDFEIANGKLKEYKGNSERVEIPKEVERIGHEAFKGKNNLKEVIIPLSVNKIDTEAFKNCPQLEEIFIPESVELIEDSFVTDCQSFKCVCVAKENRHYKSVDGVLYSKDGDVLLLYPPQKKDKIFEIPDGVTKVSDFVFASCPYLERVVINEDLEEIEQGAFILSPNLMSIDVCDENSCFRTINGSLYSKDKRRIERCVGKFNKELVIDGCTEVIGEYAFYGNQFLERAIIPYGVVEIEPCAFFECTSLTHVEIPEGVTRLGYSSFCKCKSLKSVKLPSTLKEIIAWSFSECESLERLEIPEGVSLIDYGVFHETNLTLLVKENSYGHKYAEKNNLKFELV